MQRFVALTLTFCLCAVPSTLLAADSEHAGDSSGIAASHEPSLSTDSDVARIRTLLVAAAQPHHGLSLNVSAPIWSENGLLVSRSTVGKGVNGSRQYSQGAASGATSPSTIGWEALTIAGVIVGLTGVVVGSYGDSATCRTNNARSTSTCTSYSDAGVGLAAGGLATIVVGLVGWAVASSHHPMNQQPAPTPRPMYRPAAPRQSAPPISNAPGSGAESPSAPAGGSSALPPVQRARNSNGATTWTIVNQTQYPLQISFTGATALSVTVPAGASQTYNMIAGAYVETARVVGADDIPQFSGSETVEQGLGQIQGFRIVTVPR